MAQGAAPLNPRSLLFTLYGDYVHPSGEEDVEVGALVRAAREFGVTGNALRSAISRMTREGWLEPDRSPGARPRYRLSARGLALIDEGIARIYGRHRPTWDGRWLLVTYSLPEKRRGQRDRLRLGLTFLGFGSMGNGLFVSPHDQRRAVLDLIERSGAERDVTMHHGTLEWPDDPAQVVARAWDLRTLARRYDEFGGRLSALRSSVPADDADAFQRRFRLTHEFRRFPFADPDLPDVLLPPDWAGNRTRELFFEANAALRDAAMRHWRRIATSTTIDENGARSAGSTGRPGG